MERMLVCSRRIRLLALAAVVCFSGCAKKPDVPTAPTDPNAVVYAAIGASDAIGVGSAVICVGTLDCPNGTSYVYLLKRRLEAAGRTVTLANLGVPGAVMSPAIQALGRQLGDDLRANFIEQQVPFVSATATHVTIFAGANDTNIIARAIRAGIPGSDTPNDIRAYVDRQVQQWGTDFEDLVRRIRARAPNARIIAYNLPNLGALPYVGGNTLQERGVVQRIAVGLSDRINAMTGQNVLVIDLMCSPALYSSANLAGDGFHPNDRGYQLMADMAYPAMSGGTAPPPGSACAQRTLLPVF
jgi:lysophospholipase L1-like esterase